MGEPWDHLDFPEHELETWLAEAERLLDFCGIVINRGARGLWVDALVSEPNSSRPLLMGGACLVPPIGVTAAAAAGASARKLGA